MILGRHGARRRAIPPSEPGLRPLGTPRGTLLPYDYAATFKLRGEPGNLVQDVITISPEGVFVAVAIGYGFEEERAREVTIAAPGTTPVKPGDILLSQIPQQSLIEGFRVDPQFDSLVFSTQPGNTNGARRTELELSDQPVAPSLLSQLFQRVKPPGELSFLFSVIDSATGRELQDEPTHNLASLGIANGQRPFRLLAQPLTFLPRSTIRLQVIEGSQDTEGTLFIVLYGYKLLASSACPEPLARSLLEAAARPAEAAGSVLGAAVPFDYVARFDLAGSPGRRVDTEITVNAEGGFVATALGYGLAAEDQSVPINLLPKATIAAPGAPGGAARSAAGTVTITTTAPHGFSVGDHVKIAGVTDPSFDGTFVIQTVPSPTTFTYAQAPAVGASGNGTAALCLSSVRLRDLPANALTDGIRIRPDYLRIAFQDDGTLDTSLDSSLAGQIFERLNRPEDVSFRYTISDTGLGRDWQNKPIYNVAGLGIANGRRPFKKFARPMVFPPRSTISVTVEERLGRGTLYLVFQGYRIPMRSALGGPS